MSFRLLLGLVAIALLSPLPSAAAQAPVYYDFVLADPAGDVLDESAGDFRAHPAGDIASVATKQEGDAVVLDFVFHGDMVTAPGPGEEWSLQIELAIKEGAGSGRNTVTIFYTVRNNGDDVLWTRAGTGGAQPKFVPEVQNMSARALRISVDMAEFPPHTCFVPSATLFHSLPGGSYLSDGIHSPLSTCEAPTAKTDGLDGNCPAAGATPMAIASETFSSNVVRSYESKREGDRVVERITLAGDRNPHALVRVTHSYTMAEWYGDSFTYAEGGGMMSYAQVGSAPLFPVFGAWEGNVFVASWCASAMPALECWGIDGVVGERSFQVGSCYSGGDVGLPPEPGSTGTTSSQPSNTGGTPGAPSANGEEEKAESPGPGTVVIVAALAVLAIALRARRR